MISLHCEVCVHSFLFLVKSVYFEVLSCVKFRKYFLVEQVTE